MISSQSSKSANNKISTFLELECLIKLLYPIRYNINNTEFAVAGTLCRQNNNNRNHAFTKKKTETEKERREAAKAVQHCKHEFKAPASQQVG